MSFFRRGDVEIHYDDEGTGVPVLLLAQGGMKSANELWNNPPWNPRVELSATNRVIGMDQRNAGRSTAPVTPEDGWHSYADDQLALLDHLEIEQCHVVGMCIGGPFLGGLLSAAPDRFISAVMLQPVGLDNNRGDLYGMFDRWVDEITHLHPDVSTDEWNSFRSNMWDGDFLFTAAEGDIARVETPMLILMGDDTFHPESTSRRIVDLAPNASLLERWKEGRDLRMANAGIKQFLASTEAASGSSKQRPVW